MRAKLRLGPGPNLPKRSPGVSPFGPIRTAAAGRPGLRFRPRLGAGRLAADADFLSIGTNDLLHFLFAADRLVGAVADLADVLEPDVLGLIRHVIEAGHAHGAWVGVCGEAAGDPTVAAALVGLGIDELSMTRVAIPEVKDALRCLTLEECREAALAAIDQAADAVEARTILEARLGTGLESRPAGDPPGPG